MMRSLRLHSS